MDKEDYTHWFWNSSAMDAFAQLVAKFDAWLFAKQCGN